MIQSTITTLLVDDDPGMGPLIGVALRDGFNVIGQVSGAEVATLAVNFRPDLILLDLQMPNVDGFEVLRVLKGHPVTAAIPVICMSATEVVAEQQRAVSMGAAGFVKKPIDVRTLGRDIKALLNIATVSMVSAAGDRKFFIAFNDGERMRLFRQEVENSFKKGRKAIVMSLLRGDEFCDESMKAPLEKDQLVYLQVVPSFIAKFPYLNEFSGVMADIEGFLAGTTREYDLFVDQPHRVLNVRDYKHVVSRLHTLKDTFSAAFPLTVYISSRGDARDTEALNEMARILCR